MQGLIDWLNQASTHAAQVDLMFLYLATLSSLFLLLVAGPIVYFVVRYRRRSESERTPQITGSNRLEATWIMIPLGLSIGTFLWAAWLYLQQMQPPRGTLDIYVVGKQWMWHLQHPDGQTEIDELHVPVGRPVRLVMISQDVIHSFYVPAFRIKQDVLPQRYTTLWFEATRTGRYHLFCAEFCGTDHARMTGWVYVMTPEEYEAWLAGEPAQSPASSGEQLFQQLGCNGCHRSDALARAPQLAGLFGQPVQLESGETVIADETYLRDSILDPQAQVVAGFDPIMPAYRGQVSEEQLLQLIAYIQSLGGAQEQGPSLTTPGAATPNAATTQAP